jgi:hypothetical protein
MMILADQGQFGVALVQKILASACVDSEEKVILADRVRAVLAVMPEVKDNAISYKRLLDELSTIPSASSLRTDNDLFTEFGFREDVVSPLTPTSTSTPTGQYFMSMSTSGATGSSNNGHLGFMGHSADMRSSSATKPANHRMDRPSALANTLSGNTMTGVGPGSSTGAGPGSFPGSSCFGRMSGADPVMARRSESPSVSVIAPPTQSSGGSSIVPGMATAESAFDSPLSWTSSSRSNAIFSNVFGPVSGDMAADVPRMMMNTSGPVMPMMGAPSMMPAGAQQPSTLLSSPVSGLQSQTSSYATFDNNGFQQRHHQH